MNHPCATTRFPAGHAPACGIILSSGSVVAAELAIRAGYDFFVVDLEFHLASFHRIADFVLAAKGSQICVFVRVPNADTLWIQQALSMGFNGILIPDVRDAQTARSVASACHFPPRGTRSNSAAVRANDYDLAGPQPAPVLVAAMIESGQGCDNAHAIASVPGVDIVVIGPWDLATELGAPGDFANAAFRTKIAAAEQGVKQAGKILGTAPHGNADAAALIARGHRMLTIGSDVALLRDAMRTQARAFRQVPNATAHPH